MERAASRIKTHEMAIYLPSIRQPTQGQLMPWATSLDRAIVFDVDRRRQRAGVTTTQEIATLGVLRFLRKRTMSLHRHTENGDVSCWNARRKIERSRLDKCGRKTLEAGRYSAGLCGLPMLRISAFTMSSSFTVKGSGL